MKLPGVLWGVAILAGVFGSAFHAAADEPVAEADMAAVSLEGLLEEGVRNNPRIQAARADWDAARARILQAWALPDPKIGYMIMGDAMIETRVGPQTDVFEAEQMVPFPGKLWERRNVAKAEAKAARAAYEAAERDVIRDLSSVYYELYSVGASIQVVEELLERVRQLEQIAQARYAGRGGSQRDVAKAQVEVSMALERLFVLRQRRKSLEARMNALTNRPAATPIGPLAEPQRPLLEPALEDLLALAERGRPELEGAQQRVEEGRHAKRLARMEYLPDVSVGFRYTRIGAGTTTLPNDGEDAWMVPVMITVPLWQNRLIPMVREADRHLKARQADLVEEYNQTAYEVRDRYYRYETARQVVNLYESALIPEAELAFRSDMAGYEAGTQDALNLIDSERVYLNAKLTYFQALAEFLISHVELERAVGRELRDLSEPRGGRS